MDKKYKTLLKDTVIFAIGNIGSKCILFLLVPLYTNFLSQAEYGTADLVFSTSELLVPIVSLTYHNAIFRFGLAKDVRRENVLLNGLIVAVGGMLLMLGITPLIGMYGALNPWRRYLCVYVILSYCSLLEMSYLKVKDKNKAYALLSLIQTAVLGLLNVLLLAKFRIGVRGYLLANIMAAGTTFVLAFFVGGVGADLKKASFDRTLFKQMFVFSAPLILNDISWWVVQSSNKVLIEAYLGAAVLGIFTAASKIPSLINVLTNIFSQAWGISSVREIESTNDGDFYSDVLRVLVTVIFAVCIGLVTVIKPFMSIYVGADFSESWQYVPLLLAAASFASIAYYFGSLYGALKKSVNNMISTIIAAVVNLLVNILLLRRIGLWGAALGTLGSYIVLAHVRMFDVKRFLPVQVDWKRYIANCLIVLTHATLVSLDLFIYPASAAAIALFVAVNYKTVALILQTFLGRKKA